MCALLKGRFPLPLLGPAFRPVRDNSLWAAALTFAQDVMVRPRNVDMYRETVIRSELSRRSTDA